MSSLSATSVVAPATSVVVKPAPKRAPRKAVAVRTSVYRTRADFLAALGAAKGLTSGNPAYGSAVRVLVHLSWKSPKGAVAWHVGTNADVVSNAKSAGAKPGTPMPAAMLAVLATLDKAADTTARKAAAKAVRAATIA